MRHLPVVGALLPLSTSGCRNPRLFEDGFHPSLLIITKQAYVTRTCLCPACRLAANPNPNPNPSLGLGLG
jgi:hypothetical protein